MITRPRLIALAVRTLLVLLPAPAYAAELSISVSGIPTGNGQLMVAILDSESAFKGEAAPLLSLILPAREGQISFATDALPTGTYAVQIMHDKNANGELDSNLVGMPTEPWGFSNNAVGNFGPPVWADISFDLNDTKHLDIELNH